jgi:hypothetical protein
MSVTMEQLVDIQRELSNQYGHGVNLFHSELDRAIQVTHRDHPNHILQVIKY